MDNSKPAFPALHSLSDGVSYSNGMTLREYYAGQALVGLIASNDDGAGDRLTEVPKYAVDIADALIAELNKGAQG